MAKAATKHGVRLGHRLPDRTRLRLQPPVAGQDRLTELADRLAALPGVRSVDLNPLTGSILFRHDHGCDPVTAASEARLIELLPEAGAELPDPFELIAGRLAVVDSVVSRASGGRVDSWGLAFSGLVAIGLVQLARGQIAGPALTLFGEAATLALARPLRKMVR